jgi:branched-chain amino acid transport system permease protein
MLTVLGLGLILGLLNIINLAQAGMMAIGVYLAVDLVGHDWNFALAVLVATVATGLVGAVIEYAVVRRVYRRPLDAILATWGLSLVIVECIQLHYGSAPKDLDLPITGGYSLGDAYLPKYRLALLVFGLLLVLVLGLIQRYTTLGLRVRMVMSNPELASGCGINTTQVRQWTFIVGSALSGLAGALLGPISSISPDYAQATLIPAFLVVLLAGNLLRGLILASLLLSVVQTTFSVYVSPLYASVVIIAVALVLLRFRPHGISRAAA